MFDFLQGTIVERKPTHAVLDVHGVGYRIEIPLSTYQRIPSNGEVKLFTYLRISEEEIKVYGFATVRERELFLRLISSVNRLGPAKALAVLSSASVDELAQAIEQGNVHFLRQIKGIGDKIAQRLVLELKGKLVWEGDEGERSSMTRDGVHALISLGYERREAEEAVFKAQKAVGKDARLEELIKKSLESLR